MPSTFSNLLRYARSTALEATENFTTEALAACIRSDPAPILHVLERAAVIASSAEVTEVVPYTQVAYSGAGVIDLVLQIGLRDRGLEVWVEVKVAAGESGNQLQNYRTSINARRADLRPVLVTVARYPIRPDPWLIWIPWQSIRREAAKATQPYWRDFAEFLQEVQMADEFDEPITSREAASLPASAQLMGKVARILWPVLETAADRWPESPWTASEDDLRKNLALWFRQRGRFTAQMHGYVRRGAWLDIGVWEGDEPELGVTVVTEPKSLDVRTAVIAIADNNGLPPTWARQLSGWHAVSIRSRLIGFSDHDAARGWLLARLEELGSAGLLSLIGRQVPLDREDRSE
jgi:hypothetical protein